MQFQLLALLAVPLAAGKVPLEIHLMSKCPDARACVDLLIAPALPEISDLVDFRMNFIGRAESNGISCKHGPEECLGNMLHLCGAQLATPPSPPLPEDYFAFSKCLLDNYPQVANGTFVKACADSNDVDFDAVNECAADIGPEGGISLLEQSVKRSSDAGVQKSCTVRLAEEIFCVRDDNEWKDCPSGSSVEDLVGAVKSKAGVIVGEL